MTQRYTRSGPIRRSAGSTPGSLHFLGSVLLGWLDVDWCLCTILSRFRSSWWTGWVSEYRFCLQIIRFDDVKPPQIMCRFGWLCCRKLLCTKTWCVGDTSQVVEKSQWTSVWSKTLFTRSRLQKWVVVKKVGQLPYSTSCKGRVVPRSGMSTWTEKVRVDLRETVVVESTWTNSGSDSVTVSLVSVL